MRYSDSPGAKIYRAGASRVTPNSDARPEELPAGTSADAPAKKPAKRGASGFGSAGTRTKEQAAGALAAAGDLVASFAPDAILCFTDGACQGNPGPCGAGAVVKLPDGRHLERSKALGIGTNNVGELSAVGLALDSPRGRERARGRGGRAHDGLEVHERRAGTRLEGEGERRPDRDPAPPTRRAAGADPLGRRARRHRGERARRRAGEPGGGREQARDSEGRCEPPRWGLRTWLRTAKGPREPRRQEGSASAQDSGVLFAPWRFQFLPIISTSPVSTGFPSTSSAPSSRTSSATPVRPPTVTCRPSVMLRARQRDRSSS